MVVWYEWAAWVEQHHQSCCVLALLHCRPARVLPIVLLATIHICALTSINEGSLLRCWLHPVRVVSGRLFTAGAFSEHNSSLKGAKLTLRDQMRLLKAPSVACNRFFALAKVALLIQAHLLSEVLCTAASCRPDAAIRWLRTCCICCRHGRKPRGH